MLRADAIVVLGCRITPSGRLTAPAARRAATAAAAFLVGGAPAVDRASAGARQAPLWVVASGGRRWGSHVEAKVLARELARAGVPEGAIVEELCSLSTYENAVFSAALLRRLGARRAAVVTCPWHMTRALASFRAAGVDACPLPTRSVPASVPIRAYLRAHELACGWLDARAMRRAGVLVASAGAQFLPALADEAPRVAEAGPPGAP